LPALQSLDESVEELAAKHLRDGGDGEQELVVRDTDPAAGVDAEATAGDDRVQVRVEEQLASPGVQHQGKAELRCEWYLRLPVPSNGRTDST
jgi:hypothetical protein